MAQTSDLAKRLSGLSRWRKATVLLGTDMLLVAPALYAAVFAQLPRFRVEQTFLDILPHTALLVVVCALASLLTGVAFIRLRDYFDAKSIRQSILLAIILVAAAWLLLGGRLPPAAFAMFGMIFFIMSFASRILMYEVLVAIYRRAPNVTRVLIYGAGTTGVQMASALRRHDTIDPVAFVDDNAALHGLTLAGLKVYSPTRLPQLARQLNVKRVILAMPSQPLPRQQLLARRLASMGLEVQTLPSFAQLIGEEMSLDRLASFNTTSFLERDHRRCDGALVAGAYRGKSVLISGAGGSIGSELSRQVLAHRPRRLVLFELNEHALFRVDRELRAAFEGTETEIVPILGSVTDSRLVRNALRDHAVEIVLHAAAYKHVPLVEANVVAGLANNVIGTHTLAREAEATGVERFILISSDKAVRPANVMGATKRLAELVVQDIAARSGGTHFAAVRFGNVLGSSGSVVPIFREQIASGGPVTLTDWNASRYFMTVEEAAYLVLVAAASAKGGETFVLDMGEPVLIRDLARKMIQAAGYRVRDEQNPDGDIEIRVIGLREGERIDEPSVTEGAKPSGMHPSILVVEPERLSEFEIATVMRAIRSAVSSGNKAGIDDLLARFVHDYRPAESSRRAALP